MRKAVFFIVLLLSSQASYADQLHSHKKGNHQEISENLFLASTAIIIGAIALNKYASNKKMQTPSYHNYERDRNISRKAGFFGVALFVIAIDYRFN